MSDTENDAAESECYESEMIATIKINTYMSCKCRDCSLLTSTIKQGFSDGVSSNICEYVTCEKCSTVIHAIQNHNSKWDCSTVNMSKHTLDEDLEIFVFIEMNKFLTAEEFANLLYTGDDDGHDNDCIFKYYGIVKRLYGISVNTERLKYEAWSDNDFDFLQCT